MANRHGRGESAVIRNSEPWTVVNALELNQIRCDLILKTGKEWKDRGAPPTGRTVQIGLIGPFTSDSYCLIPK